MAVTSFRSTGNAARDLRHAAVARRANDLSDARAALHGPGQRMFAAAGTKDEDFHEANFRSGGFEPERLWSATRGWEVKQAMGR